jgi:hypothetical protein
MRTNAIQISAYFSHPIRGLKGPQASVEDMSLNNDIAACVGGMLHNFCPSLDLYIPAVHDEYVTEAYLRGSTPEDEVLEIDKIILGRRKIMIGFAYNGVISNGMKVEIEHASDIGTPVFMFEKVTEIPELVERILDWYYNEQLS